MPRELDESPSSLFRSEPIFPGACEKLPYESATDAPKTEGVYLKIAGTIVYAMIGVPALLLALTPFHGGRIYLLPGMLVVFVITARIRAIWHTSKL